MRNSGRRRPRWIRSSRTARQASVLSPPMLLAASNTFWPSVRTPITTSSEIDVAFRSSRTRTTVPSRINRTIGSSASERASVPSLPIAPYFPPHPADNILTEPVSKQRLERTADTARIGPGQVRRGNQGVCRQCAALIGPQHLALPFTGLPVRADQAGARHLERDPPKGPGQRS